jgi:hypothetical protein
LVLVERVGSLEQLSPPVPSEMSAVSVIDVVAGHDHSERNAAAVPAVWSPPVQGTAAAGSTPPVNGDAKTTTGAATTNATTSARSAPFNPEPTFISSPLS